MQRPAISIFEKDQEQGERQRSWLSISFRRALAIGSVSPALYSMGITIPLPWLGEGYDTHLEMTKMLDDSDQFGWMTPGLGHRLCIRTRVRLGEKHRVWHE